MRAGALARTCFTCNSIYNCSLPAQQSAAARNRWVPGRCCEVYCGGVLLSHNLSVAVPLALPGLASRFGMEAGRFPGAMTTTRMGVQHCPPLLLVGVWVDRGLYSGCGRLFTVFV